jgi:glyoxylase-like metal-dependent hydrolase (beta-lactamase superfamily II)
MILMVVLLVCTACGGQSVASAAAESTELSAQATPEPAEEPAAEAMDSEAADSAEESGPTAEELGFALVEVADGLYSFGDGGAYGAFLVTDEGVIVMDTVSTTQAPLMMDAIKSVTDQPVKYLLYSHNHWDHISGGQIFKDAGAIVLAHQDVYDWLANHPTPNPNVVVPDLTWNGARHDIVLGGKTVELHHFGPSHGQGMTVFRFPAENTIFTVDLVVPKRVGFAYMPDFTPRGWMATLAEMEQLEFETVMFAHNAAFGPRSSLTEQREFLEDLQNEIVTRMQAGENPGEIVNTIELPKYQDWAGYDAWLTMNAWRIMLEMFMGQ